MTPLLPLMVIGPKIKAHFCVPAVKGVRNTRSQKLIRRFPALLPVLLLALTSVAEAQFGKLREKLRKVEEIGNKAERVGKGNSEINAIVSAMDSARGSLSDSDRRAGAADSGRRGRVVFSGAAQFIAGRRSAGQQPSCGCGGRIGC